MMRIVQITTDNREHFKDYDAPQPYFGAAPTALFEGLSQLSDVEVHIISCLRRPVSAPDRWADNIHYHACVVPKAGWMATLYAGCTRAAHAVIADLAADILHGQGTEQNCALAALHPRYPSVITIHGNVRALARNGYFGGPVYGRLASMLEARAVSKASGVICNSRYTENEVRARARQTWQVPNAVRRCFVDAPLPVRAASPVPQLLNIGLVTPNKRSLEVLRAVREVVQSGCPLRMVFVGHIPQSSPYGRQFVEELKIAEKEGWAAHVGYVDADRLVALMDESDALVHMPVMEAFGLVAAEAASRNLKLFVSPAGGLVGIADDMDGAEIADSPVSLTKLLGSWIRGGCLRPSRAAEEARRRYHPVQIAERHVEIYRSLIASA